MKIGILKPLIGIGGAEMSLTEMGAVLSQAGHDVWMHFDAGSNFVTKNFNKFGKLEKRCSNSSKKFMHNDATSEEWAIEQLKDTDLVISIHRHFYSKKLALAVNNVSKKIVYAPGKNEHHIYGCYPNIEGYGKLIENINIIMFNSKHTYDLHNKKKYPLKYKKLFRHIHPPMDTLFYESYYQKLSKEAAKEDLGLDKQFTVGIFGRLIPSKKPIEVVNIASQIVNARRFENIHFYFIGDGPERSSIVRKRSNLNLESNVKLLGMRELPFKEIAAMDCILHMCDHESMSRALREAMFMEKPIVAFNGAGNKELCSGHLSRILFSNQKQAINRIEHLYSKREDVAKFGKLSRERILAMEKIAIRDLLRIVKSI